MRSKEDILREDEKKNNQTKITHGRRDVRRNKCSAMKNERKKERRKRNEGRESRNWGRSSSSSPPASCLMYELKLVL